MAAICGQCRLSFYSVVLETRDVIHEARSLCAETRRRRDALRTAVERSQALSARLRSERESALDRSALKRPTQDFFQNSRHTLERSDSGNAGSSADPPGW